MYFHRWRKFMQLLMPSYLTSSLCTSQEQHTTSIHFVHVAFALHALHVHCEHKHDHVVIRIVLKSPLVDGFNRSFWRVNGLLKWLTYIKWRVTQHKNPRFNSLSRFDARTHNFNCTWDMWNAAKRKIELHFWRALHLL